MNRVEIAPGAYLTTLTGEKFKRCRISVHFVLPSLRETATALAILPHVLERRCESIQDPTLLSRHLFNLYGADLSSDSMIIGANRVIAMSVSGLKDKYALNGENLSEEYLSLVCELLFAPKLANGVFETEDVEIECAKQADYLRSEMNDKRTYCLRQARRKLFGNSPLGTESGGYLEDIEKITPQVLYAAYKDFISRATIEIIVCGTNGDAATKAITARLAQLNRAPVAPSPSIAIEKPAAFSAHSEEMETVQGKLCILCPSGKAGDARQDAVMRVASAVLGGLPTSRLFVNVREKQSLCYYCSSSYASFSGVLTLDSGVDHSSAEKAATAILHELETLQNSPVTIDELKFAHSALENAYCTAQDSPDALVNWEFAERMRGTSLSLNEAITLIKSVTAVEVQAALASFMPALQYTITGKDVG